MLKLLDRPDGDWPIMLCALCASILGFLALWLVAKVISSVFQHVRAQSTRRLQNNRPARRVLRRFGEYPWQAGKKYRRPRR